VSIKKPLIVSATSLVCGWERGNQNRRSNMATTNTKTPPNAKAAKAPNTRKAARLPIYKETYYAGLGLFDWMGEHFWSFEKELVVRGEKRHAIIAKKTKELRERMSKRVKELPGELTKRTETLKSGLGNKAREIQAGARKQVKQIREPVQQATAPTAESA
jgi:hypothetical protein